MEEKEKYTTADFVEDAKAVLAVIGAFVLLYGCFFLCCID